MVLRIDKDELNLTYVMLSTDKSTIYVPDKYINFITHPLAGELAEHRGNVTGVLCHDLSNCLLHSNWYTPCHAGHNLLQFKKR